MWCFHASHTATRMLRFGLLKYKKLNSSSSISSSGDGGGEALSSCEGTTLGPWDDNGNQQPPQRQTLTPVQQQQQQNRHHHHRQIHNQLNGSAMKNVRIFPFLSLCIKVYEGGDEFWRYFSCTAVKVAFRGKDSGVFF